MIFTFLSCLFPNSLLFVFLIGIPVYLFMLTVWELFYYYSSLFISLDLFIVNYQLTNQNNLLSSLVSEWIDYQTQQTKLKEYEPKQVEIDDAIKHTLDKLSK